MDPITLSGARSPLDDSFDPGRGSFWAGLFDLGFTRFVTPKLVRTLYLLGMLVAIIIAVGAVFAALFESGFWAFLWTLIFAPVWLVVVFVILRIIGELAIVTFRIAQATMQTAENTKK